MFSNIHLTAEFEIERNKDCDETESKSSEKFKEYIRTTQNRLHSNFVNSRLRFLIFIEI